MRKLDISDAQDVFDYASDPKVSKYLTWDRHKSIDESIEYIRKALDRYEKDEAGEWAVILRDINKMIGAIGFVQLDPHNFCGTIGYVIGSKYWGKGLMTEAVRKLIDFAFSEMGLNRIEAYHAIDNEASGRVMQKAGMSFEGVLRQKMFAKEKFWDVREYAVIKDDWGRV
ncbi:MAG: GNAT family N-acetyltransferase [Bacillota bacterium]|nr:GNAT family N-acetyltransferase [Bacillota bacterium]